MSFKSIAPAATLAALLLVGCGQESETPHTHAVSQEKEVKLETTEQKVSYGIGVNIGRQLSDDSADIDPQTVIAGINDLLSGSELKMSDEEIQQAFQEMREKAMEEQRKQAEEAAQVGVDFLAENAKKEGINVTETGLQYEVLSASDAGASPSATDTVRVHYHGTLINGDVFDSSVDRGQPAEFPVNRVIAGWTEALQMMKVGDKWKLYIPAELAYGERSPSASIPPHSALIFEVELLDVLGAE